MNILSFFLALALLFFTAFSSVRADTPFIVTSFDSQKSFTWTGGPIAGCSAINSWVMTYYGNNQQVRFDTCEDTFGSTADPVPDGIYYIQLDINGVNFDSQVFTIQNGMLLQPSPTQTPTPVNQSPKAMAGTSLDGNGNLQLDGSLSSDPENDPLTYTWKITELHKTYSGQKVSIVDLPAGTYTVTISVSDNHSQSTNATRIGITTTRPKPTVKMTVQNILLNKNDGSFLIKGAFDKKSMLLSNITSRPSGRLLFELQTSGTTSAPVYGVVGESTQTLQTINKLLEY